MTIACAVHPGKGDGTASQQWSGLACSVWVVYVFRHSAPPNADPGPVCSPCSVHSVRVHTCPLSPKAPLFRSSCPGSTRTRSSVFSRSHHFDPGATPVSTPVVSFVSFFSRNIRGPRCIAALPRSQVIKKIGTFGFYKAAESYGWDRLYRRLLKFNRE